MHIQCIDVTAACVMWRLVFLHMYMCHNNCIAISSASPYCMCNPFFVVDHTHATIMVEGLDIRVWACLLMVSPPFSDIQTRF